MAFLHFLPTRAKTLVHSLSKWLACSVVLVPLAVAQEKDTIQTAQTDTAKLIQLEHVIVYGEKIKRSYLETYSSVGIVNAEDLESYDIADTSDAFKRLANVRAFADGTGTSGISIRGLNADGITQPANSASLISVVVDGVTQSAEGLKRGSRGLWDVQQLEVHRGPQSTLQGRNALGGSVVVQTKNPSFVQEFKVKAIYGELDRQEVAVAISGPIIANELAYRLSGEHSEKTSKIAFADPANKPFAEDEYHNIRGKLLYTPEDMESVEVLLTISHVFDSPSSSPVSGPDFYDRQFAASSLFAEFREMSLQNYSADIAYQMSESVTIRAVTAYHDTDLKIGSSPASASFFRSDHRKDSDFTQELRLEIDNSASPISGVAGLLYGAFEQQADSLILFSGVFVAQDGTFENETETVALYGDFRYQFSNSVALLFGGRYQKDTVRNAANFVSDLGAGGISDLETDYDEFLPKLGVSFELGEEQTAAVTASRGYRQGFAEVRLGTDNQVVSVDPEFLWAYEIAYRYSGADRGLVLGANVFYNDYTDQQVTVTNPDFAPFTNTLNAGDSTSWGLELEAQYDFGGGFTAYAAFGFLETELGDFSASSCSNERCSGNEYSEAPEYTASLGGVYNHSSGFFTSVSSNYTDEFYKTIDNSESLKVDSNFLLNTVIGYRFKQFKVSLYCNNVLNERYLRGIGSVDEATVGDGRATGLEVLATF